MRRPSDNLTPVLPCIKARESCGFASVVRDNKIRRVEV